MVKYYTEIENLQGNVKYATFILEDGYLIGQVQGYMTTPTLPPSPWHRRYRFETVLDSNDFSKVSVYLEYICNKTLPAHIKWRIPSESEQETLRLLYG